MRNFDESYNERPGRVMRFCEVCGVGLGLMTREEYVEKFMYNKGVCSVCGNEAVKREVEAGSRIREGRYTRDRETIIVTQDRMNLSRYKVILYRPAYGRTILDESETDALRLTRFFEYKGVE